MTEPQASPKKTLSLPEAPAAPGDVRAEIAKAPDHWPADVRAEFAEAPPLWQKFMLDRTKGLESGYTKRNQRMATERKTIDEYRDRWRSYAVRLGEIRGEPVNMEALVARLLEFEIAVEAVPPEQRAAVILNIARETFGLPVGAFAETIMAAMHAGAMDIPADDPDRQAAEQAAEQAISEDIVAFAGALDAGGQPKHPYFAEVEVEMRDLAAVDVSKGRRSDLGDLYSKAIRLNPVVSAQVAETERRQATTQRDAHERERIAKAKAANGSITGGGGGGRDPVGGSVAEILDREVPTTGW